MSFFLSKLMQPMRTAELINLLRNPERNAAAREHLSTLHHTVLVHLLGELANWLTVEIVKYQERQALSSSSSTPSSLSPHSGGDNSPKEPKCTLETFQQYQIRKQIRLTLSAIQTVLGSVQGTHTLISTHVTSLKTQEKKAIALDDTKKEQILESLLRPILTGCVPLGPRADSSEIQLMCAKILKFLTNKRAENGLFLAEDAIKVILALSDTKDRPSGTHSQDQAKRKPRLRVHLATTLNALLSSPLAKLQDCGIFLLANHRSLRQQDAAWASISPLKSILESLQRNLDDIGLGHLETSDDEAGRQMVTKELDAALSHQHRALTLLNLFIQDVVHKGQEGESSQRSADMGTARLGALKDAGKIELLVGLWTGILRIVIPDQAQFTVRDQLVAMTTNIVYGTCYVFKDEAIVYLMNEGAETLMAWYAYFIVPHDHLLEEGFGAGGKSEEESYRSRAQALQCCARLGEIIVTTERYQPVSMGEGALLGRIFMRRSIEFLITILEVTLPIEDAELQSLSSGTETTMTVPYAIRIIKRRPEVLEAMLSIVLGSLGYLKGGYMEAAKTKLVFVLVVLLVDLKSLFGKITISDSSQQRIRSYVTSLLIQILSWEGDTGLQDIPLNLWTLGCVALVDMIMIPLERVKDTTGQQDASSSQSMDSHGVKAVQILIQFWKQNPKGRSLLAALYGPRFFQPFMVKILLDISKNDLPLASSRGLNLTSWNMERITNLLELMTYMGVESSIRIHMRESWSALVFLVALLSASFKQCLDHRFRLSDHLPQLVVHQCFQALACFRFDQTALVQLIRVELGSELFDLFGCSLDSLMFPGSIIIGPPGRNPATLSIVPVLLGILEPPYRQWTVDTMLGTESIRDDKHRVVRRKLVHPLLERWNPLVLEAAMLLGNLTHFQEGQLAVISKPGAIWTLSRILVERTIAQEQERKAQPQGPARQDQSNLENGSPHSKSPLEMALDGSQRSPTSINRHPPITSAFYRNPLDRALLEILSRVVSSANVTKALVVNNTITELFSSILTIDHPPYFHRNTTVYCQDEFNDAGDEANTHASTQSGHDILPSTCQHSVYCAFFAYFRHAMEPLLPLLQRLHDFAAVGASSTADDAEEISDMLFGLQEQCAVVFVYLSRPESFSSLDSNDLLASGSHLGDVFRMLTLEMDYTADSDANEMDEDQVSVEGARREASALRKFMAGLAIQSWTWRHVDVWRERHKKLMESYDNVLTAEREDHVEKLKRQDASAKLEPTTPMRFLVENQVVSFSDRSLLVHASSYFSSLLTGQFLESHQDQVTLHDVDPVDIQMLFECLQESITMPSHFLLPEDLPFGMVLRLMICAERYSIQFIKRLAELWILTVLQKRERKWDELIEQSQDSAATKKRTPESPLSGHEDKKAKFDDGDLGVKQAHSDDAELPQTEAEGEEESIQECLLMVYEQCSDPRHGDIYTSHHPFFGLVWDVLARLCLRLGSVATLPRFQKMIERGGEEKIQEFLKVVHGLMLNQMPE